MKCVTEVRVGDKVRVEGYGFNSDLDDTGYLASMSGQKRVVNYVDPDGRFQTNPHIWFHLRNIVEIIECAPGAHVLQHGMLSGETTCTRCTSYKELEPVCWCGSLELGHMASMNMKHPFQPERRKEDRRKRDWGIEGRPKGQEWEDGVPYIWKKFIGWWDQRGTIPDRRKGGSK